MCHRVLSGTSTAAQLHTQRLGTRLWRSSLRRPTRGALPPFCRSSQQLVNQYSGRQVYQQQCAYLSVPYTTSLNAEGPCMQQCALTKLVTLMHTFSAAQAKRYSSSIFPVHRTAVSTAMTCTSQSDGVAWKLQANGPKERTLSLSQKWTSSTEFP